MENWDLIKRLEREPQLLSSMEPLPEEKRVHLQRFDGVDLAGFERVFPNLVSLQIESAPKLSDISALGKLPDLTVLMLESCAALQDISCLKGHRSLCVAQLVRTGIQRAPEGMEKVCVFRDVGIQKRATMVALGPPRPPVALKKGQRAQIAKLKKLLNADVFESIQQGLDLVQTLDDTDLFEELTRSIRYESASVSVKYYTGRAQQRLASSHIKGRFAQDAMLGLLRLAPAGTRLASVRDRLHRLDFVVSTADQKKGKALDVHLSSLAGLPIEKVWFFNTGPLSSGPPPSLPALKSLKLQAAPWPQDDLQQLAGAPNLQDLDFFQCWLLKRLDGIEALKNLEMFRIYHTQVQDLSPLKGLSKLERLYTHTTAGLEKILPSLSALRLLNTSRTPDDSLRAACEAQKIKLSR